MIRYPSVDQILELHIQVLELFGGATGLRVPEAVDSAVAQMAGSFGGHELYPTVPEKASSPCFSLVMNHPFVDGNKRVGFAAMDVFLDANGYDFGGAVDDQEQTILTLAAGNLSRDEFTQWVQDNAHLRPGAADDPQSR